MFCSSANTPPRCSRRTMAAGAQFRSGRHNHLSRLLPQGHPRDCSLSPGRLGSSAALSVAAGRSPAEASSAPSEDPRGASGEHHNESRDRHGTTSRRGQQHQTSLSAHRHRGVPTQEPTPWTVPHRRRPAITRAPLRVRR